ncbi:Hypothetical predicted protein [Mytilus galloprovincialis]|uniref:Uncharacterized protein n=1 Tax=Mytilus galloprovincialis TaxID=29158 RepID=A0A8B6DJW3_MYTGA|nr:Hypothetical predicted protein [Mytilus galloprovincialis]
MNIFFVLLFLSLFHEKAEGDAVQIETVDSKPGDPLSIPLISDGGAPLVAMLDTSSMKVRIKSFIKTLMGKMIDESLTKDSTTDIIRNITKLELNEELVNVVMNHVTFRQEIQNIVKETLKQNSTIDLIRNIAVQELNGQLRQRNQSEDKVISDSDQDIEVDKISKPISVTDVFEMEFVLVVNLFFLLWICNGFVFGSSTQSSIEAAKKETGIICIQSDINGLKDDMHELLKRVSKNENEIEFLKSENQYLTNELTNKRRQFSCEINELHENTYENQKAVQYTNTEIYHLNETIEELRNGVDRLEELERRRSEENITECIEKSGICRLA